MRPKTMVAPADEESSMLTALGVEESFSTMSTDGGTHGATQSSEPREFGEGTSASTNLVVGGVVSGYHLETLLGTGTFAEVFQAKHSSARRSVALKVLRRSMASDESLRRRVLREGQLLRGLHHPNIVEVYEVGLLEDGRAFIAMELLEGHTLKDLLTREAPLHPERAFRILEQIAAGLAAAHGAGIVHRDLKPANIFITGAPGSERVKLLDFGLARLVDRGEFTQLTRAGDLIGSPAFMAPEQVANSMNADPRADLYALGVTAYAMLAGRLPFTGTNRDVLKAQVESTAAPLPPLGGLEYVVHELLEKDPERRTASAGRLLEQLQALGEPTSELSRTFLRPEESQGPPLVAPVIATSEPVSRRERALLLSTVVLALALVATVGLLVTRSPRPMAAPQPAEAAPPVRVVVAPETDPAPEPPPQPAAALAPVDPEPRREPTRELRPSRAGGGTERRATLVRVQRELSRALRARALRVEDARVLLPSATALSSTTLPREELDALLAAVNAAPLTKPLLRARIARVLAKLETLSAEEVSPVNLPDFEARYFRLREALVSAGNEETLERLNHQVDGLEAELDRAE